MSAFPDVVVADSELCLPMKAGEITGDSGVPVAATVGTAGAELNLSTLIGDSPGCWISFDVRSNGPLYVGMAKKVTSGITLTNGVASLGVMCQKNTISHFWVSKAFPFVEVIADLASTGYVYRRSSPNRSARTNAMIVGS